MASESRVFCLQSILFFVLLCPKFGENSMAELSLNPTRAVQHLSPYFLSISLDPSMLVDEKAGSFRKGFDVAKATNMAKGLSPAFLRVGGPSTDRKNIRFEAFPYNADVDDSSGGETYENCKCDSGPLNQVTINGEQLTLLNHFAEEAGLKIVLSLGYDLNKQRKKLRNVTKDMFGYDVERDGNCDAWDLKEALEIIRFADSMKISLGYQLGYEVDYMNAVKNLQDHNGRYYSGSEPRITERDEDKEQAQMIGKALGHDLTRLRTLVDAYPRSRGSIILSPGIRLPPAFSGPRAQPSTNPSQIEPHTARKLSSFLQAFLKNSEKSVDAVVWHPSAFTGERNEQGITHAGRNSDAAVIEKAGLSKILGRSMANKPIWIGESWSDGTETESPSCNKDFDEALEWAQRLGIASKIGSQVILHSPKYNALQNPNPQYWVSLLHKKLAGLVVLDTQLSGLNGAKKRVQFFAHCTPHSIISETSSVDKFPRGSVTVYAVNPTNTSMDTFLRILPSTTRLKHKTGCFDPLVYEYVLTEEKQKGDSRRCTGRTLLNGKLLEMYPNGMLPHLIPKVIHIRKPNRFPGTKAGKSSPKNKKSSGKTKPKSRKGKNVRKKNKRETDEGSTFGVMLSIPPKSVKFWVLPPSVGVKPCLSEEDEAEEKGMMFDASRHYYLDSRGQHNLEDQNEVGEIDKRYVKSADDLNRDVDTRHDVIVRRKRRLSLESQTEVQTLTKKTKKTRVERLRSPKKGVAGKKRKADYFEDEDEYPTKQQKKRKRGKGRGKGVRPKDLSFNVGTEDDDESEDSYPKGTIYLGEEVASDESNPDNDYDYVGEDFGEDESGEGEFNVGKGDSDLEAPREDGGVWSSGTKAAETPPKEVSYRDNIMGESYYHGPGDYLMEYRNMAKSGERLTGTKGEEPNRELFEYELSSSEEDEVEEKETVLKEEPCEEGLINSDKKSSENPSRREKDDKGKAKDLVSPTESYEIGSKEVLKSTSDDEEKRDSKESSAKMHENDEDHFSHEKPSCAYKEAYKKPDDAHNLSDEDHEGNKANHEKESHSREELGPFAGDDARESAELEDYDSSELEFSSPEKKGDGQEDVKWISMGTPDSEPPTPPSSGAFKPVEMKFDRKRREIGEKFLILDVTNGSELRHAALSNSINGEGSRYPRDVPEEKDGVDEPGVKALCKRDHGGKITSQDIWKALLNGESVEGELSKDDTLGMVASHRMSEPRDYSYEILSPEKKISLSGDLSRGILSNNLSEMSDCQSVGSRKRENDTYARNWTSGIDANVGEEVNPLTSDLVDREYVGWKVRDRLNFNSNPFSMQLAATLNGTVNNETVDNGTVSNGTVNNGTVSNGMVNNGTVNNGTVNNGTVPNGTVPNGTVPNGTVPNGTVPNGTVPNGTVHNRMVPNGTANNGTVSNGTVPNGTVPNGMVPNGTVNNGTVNNGTVNNGTVNNGTENAVPKYQITQPNVTSNTSSQNYNSRNFSNTNEQRTPQTSSFSLPFNLIRQLSMLEQRRLERRRMEAERRMKLEVARRRINQQRRKAFDERRRRIEESRRRVLASLRAVPTAEILEAKTTLKEGIRLTVEKIRPFSRTVRESNQRPSTTRAVDGQTTTDLAEKVKDNKAANGLKITEKERNKRDLMQLMYDDSKRADHHRVPRKSSCEERIGDSARNSPHISSRSNSGWILSSDEHWHADRRFSKSHPGREEKFPEIVKGRGGGTADNTWPQAYNDPMEESSDWPIDTDKVYVNGPYNMLKNMFVTFPSSADQGADLVEKDKSHYACERDENRFEFQLEGKMKRKERNRNRDRKISYINMRSKKDKNQEGNIFRIHGKRNKEGRRKASQVIERRKRNTRADSYELNGISAENSIVSNKIMKYDKDIADKIKALYYLLEDKNVEKKKINGIDLDLQKSSGNEKDDKMMKKGIEYVTVKNLTWIKEKIDRAFKNISHVGKEAIKYSGHALKEGENNKRDDSFFSKIMKRMFEVMKSMQNMLKWPFEQEAKKV